LGLMRSSICLSQCLHHADVELPYDCIPQLSPVSESCSQ
jgi:hypothetical protein